MISFKINAKYQTKKVATGRLWSGENTSQVVIIELGQRKKAAKTSLRGDWTTMHKRREVDFLTYIRFQK